MRRSSFLCEIAGMRFQIGDVVSPSLEAFWPSELTGAEAACLNLDRGSLPDRIKVVRHTAPSASVVHHGYPCTGASASGVVAGSAGVSAAGATSGVVVVSATGASSTGAEGAVGVVSVGATSDDPVSDDAAVSSPPSTFPSVAAGVVTAGSVSSTAFGSTTSTLTFSSTFTSTGRPLQREHRSRPGSMTCPS